MLVGLVWIVRAAHAKGTLDASQLWKDETDKLSWGRAGAGVALLTMTWVVMVRQINGTLTIYEFGLYALTWSGSMVLLEALKVWRGKS